jgi:hypothetical protein
LFGDFTFTMEHIPGKGNRSDAVLRCPDMQLGAAVAAASPLVEEIKVAQAA